MSYCPKCGNKVDEHMAFCPRCGAPLKAGPTAPPTYQRRNERSEKQEKEEKHEKEAAQERGEKHEKGEYGFVGWLIGGLVLIIIGFFTLLPLVTNINSAISGALILLVIGVVIIIVAVYLTTIARKRNPTPS